MTRVIVGWSVRFRLVILGLAVASLVLGFLQLRQLPVEVIPEYGPPAVEIQTEALGLSAEEVEQLITVPLEADLLLGVAWLDTMTSRSVPGLSSIVLTFEPGTDELRARQMVTERLTQAHALPNVSKPPQMLPPRSPTSRVMIIALRATDMSLIDMSVLARWTIRPTLMGVPGVANVAIWGQRERQLQVLVDPERLREHRVSLEEVIESTGNALWFSPLTFLDASTPGTGGFIDTPNQRLGIQHLLPIHTAADLAKVTITQERPSPGRLTIGDVATVVEDHQPLIGDAIVDEGAGLLLVVERFPGADTLEVTRGLEDALAALRPGLAGIEIDSGIYRPATYLEAATRSAGSAGLLALLLMFIALLIVSGLRRAFVATTAVAASLLAAMLVLFVAGGSLNALVVAGLALALGVVVDDAVLGARAVEGSDVPETTAAVRSPLTVALAVIVLGTVPAFFVAGLAGHLAAAVALSFLAAVAASLVVALTLTPALASFVQVDARQARSRSAVARRLEAAHASLLERASGRSTLLLAGAAVASVASIGLVAASVSLAPQPPGSLMPNLRLRDVLVAVQGPSGASRTEMSGIVTDISRQIRGVPGVRDVGAHIGRAITSDQVVGIDEGEVWVSIDEGADLDSTVATLEAIVEAPSDATSRVLTYPRPRADTPLGLPDRDIVVRVYGQEFETLSAQAEAVRAALVGVAGIDQVEVERPAVRPAIEVSVDPALVAEYGIKPGDVRRAATTLVSGLEVGSLFEDQKVFEVVVRGVPAIRDAVEDIGRMEIDTPAGGWVRLADVASVDLGDRPSAIAHESGFRYLDVTASAVGSDIDGVLRDVDAALAGFEFPREYHTRVFSPAAEERAGLLRLLAVVCMVALGAALILQAAFGSWRRAGLLLLLPAAVSGCAVGMIATGGAVSVGLLAGFGAVAAVTTRQLVSLFAHYHDLEWGRGELLGVGLIVMGARERLGSVAATNLVTMVAMLAILVLGDVPGLEVVRAMAAAIVGGLCTSTIFVLLVAPVAYLRSGPSPQPESYAGLLAEDRA